MNNTAQITGLAESEVKERLKKGLRNSFQVRPTRSYLRLVLENVFSFYNLLLMSSITLLIFLGGDRGVFLSTLLLVFNISIGLIQEIRAKFLLDKLSLMSPRFATVRRSGKNIQVNANDIVKDDVIILHPGDAVIADGSVLKSDSLEIDESSLTGESRSVLKKTGDMLYSGSYCMAGSAVMRAEKIGRESSLNQLKIEAKAFKKSKTPLENLLERILRVLIVTIAVFGPLTLIAGTSVQLSLSDSVENMVNLLFSLVPQGLITSVAVLFAYGAIRVSRSHSIVQKMNAVESMGHVKILCADKTGTLTKNSLCLYEIVPFRSPIEDVRSKLSLFAHNVSSPNQTILALTDEVRAPKTSPNIILEVPFKSERGYSGISFEKESFILGTPELLLKDSFWKSKASEYARKGLRVLVFAQQKDKLDDDGGVHIEKIDPLALIVLGDEVRHDVSHTLKEFSKLNIQVKIISGDNSETVRAIAGQAGIVEATEVSQNELELLKNHEFDRMVRKTILFSRIKPEMKRRIINSLMQEGAYTAMVGDGVNDVLALKKAHVSIAMNSGAQAAKDVSDIILLDNSFSTLPKAIEEGREITSRVYAAAKIFFVKVIYFMVLFFLVGFANLPFPINLRQTTLLGFMITGVPIILITVGLLSPKKAENPRKDFFEFIFSAGVIGGLAMTYITVISVGLLKLDIEFSRTLVTIFASLYSSAVLFNIVGISLFDPGSILKNKLAFFIIVFLTVESIILPVFFFPEVFDLVKLKFLHWLLLAVLAASSSYILTSFNGKFSFRRLWSN